MLIVRSQARSPGHAHLDRRPLAGDGRDRAPPTDLLDAPADRPADADAPGARARLRAPGGKPGAVAPHGPLDRRSEPLEEDPGPRSVPAVRGDVLQRRPHGVTQG